LALFDDALARGGSGEVEAHFNRGLVLEELDRKEEAEDAYRSALVLDDAYPPAAFHLGRLLFEEGEDTEGLALIDLAIEGETNPLQKRALEHSRDELVGQGDILPSPQG
jgi:tetratricopeptide (TPR) repeat protein